MTYEQLIEKLQELIGERKVLPTDQVKLSYIKLSYNFDIVKKYDCKLNIINLTTPGN